jgi:preprotein translocase subunit SecE
MARRGVASALGGPRDSRRTEGGETKNVTRIRRYFDEVWSELKKVSWPTRDQVRNLTVLVFVISFVVGVYITVLDTIFRGFISALNGI